MLEELYPFVGILIGGTIMTAMVFFLDKQERKQRQARNAAQKEAIKNNTFDPKKEWMRVPGDMQRIEVDGGWIYRDYLSGHSITICFVPFPEKTKKLKGL